MILLEKRAHLVLEIPLDVVRLLSVDVTQESVNISRTDREQSVSTLPSKLTNSVLLHPNGRSGLDFRHNFRRCFCRAQPHRKMNVVGDSTYPKTFAIQFASGSGQICVKGGNNAVANERRTMFCAEDDMHQVKAQRLRHAGDYMSGLQPSPVLADTYLGLRPRLVCRQAFGLHRLSIQPAANPPGTQQYTSPDYVSGLQPSPALDDAYLGLRPRLVCSRAFGPHGLSIQPAGNQPRTQQPSSPGQVPWNQAARTRPEMKPRHIQSAKGAKHTSLGRGPRYTATDNQRGLKARHNRSAQYAETVSSAYEGAITS
jgi:hypothetical protein